MADNQTSQETRRMQEWLRPYLAPDYVATQGPDQDKEFIRDYARRIAEALPEKLSARPERPRRIMVITRGTYGILHIPGAAGLLILLRDAAEKYHAFELTELYDDTSINGEMLSAFDAVVLNNVGMAGNAEVYNRLLPEYVRNGGGLFAVHGSALLFMKEPAAEYNRLLGAYVDTVNTQHGHPTQQGKPFPVRLAEPGHPLVAAFHGEATPLTVTHSWLSGQERRKYEVTIRPPKELADELYVLIPTPGQQNPPRVLVAVDREKAEQVYPESAGEFAYALTWTKLYGKGRVYYTQLGHNMAVYSVPCVAQAMLDGLQYAAGDLARENADAAQGLTNPIFPYHYKPFDGDREWLAKMGYTPFRAIGINVDLGKDPPYDPGVHDLIRALGGERAVIYVSLRLPAETDEARAVAVLRDLASVAEREGRGITLYPHAGYYIATARDALAMAKKVDRKNVGVTLNLCHELAAGNADRLPQILDEVKDRLTFVVIHGADRPKEGERIVGWERLIQPLGEGDFDVYPFLKHMKAVGFDGPVGLICWDLKEPAVDHLTKSMHAWQAYWARLAAEARAAQTTNGDRPRTDLSRAEKSVTADDTSPARIAKCEWIVFTDQGKQGTLPALRIVTEDGADGFWVGDYSVPHGRDEVMAMLQKLHGLDTSSPELLWDQVCTLGFPGYLEMAVDIAAWDRLGRAAGKPVAELLGPSRRDRVALYVAGFPNMDLDQNVEAARQAVERGIGGYKIYAYLKGFGPERDPSNAEEAEGWVQQDIRVARAVREEVGDSISLMFYNGCSYNLEQAIRVGRALDELGYRIYYDPMPQNAPDSMSDYLALQKAIRTPVCAPINGRDMSMRLQWMQKGAIDINEIDVYAGFTPCLRVVRACEKAGMPLDLHGGFINDIYQFPLYGAFGDAVLPWIGLHNRNPMHIPVAAEFRGTEPERASRPWVKRIQARPVDAKGFVRLCYEMPGMGVELDWEWIQRHALDR